MIEWQQLSDTERAKILSRPVMNNKAGLSAAVSELINEVREQGDATLKSFTKRFDQVELEEIAIPEALKEFSLLKLSDKSKSAIDLAYKNIRAFHLAQIKQTVEVETCPGVTCQLKTAAISDVGLYIPGGSAPLPSTVLMLGVPAQIAGCSRIVLCTPPDTSDSNFASITPEILYAAKLCGVDEIYRVGGAQAIAAMAYGTESIAKVDKIYGPGNSYVTEAKQQVNNDPLGAVIDMPAGPSEVLVIADENANPAFVAADLLSQAEHGPDSQVILVSDSSELIAKTEAELAAQLARLPRAEIAEQALKNSSLILTKSLSQSIAISNMYAPEHLIVQTENAELLLDQLKNAASIFLGAYTPESAGDYASGTNHVLPTYGYSKTLSSLNLDDFTRKYTVQTVTKQGMHNIGPAILALAEAEGLEAHRNAVALRLAELEKENK